MYIYIYLYIYICIYMCVYIYIYIYISYFFLVTLLSPEAMYNMYQFSSCPVLDEVPSCRSAAAKSNLICLERQKMPDVPLFHPPFLWGISPTLTKSYCELMVINGDLTNTNDGIVGGIMGYHDDIGGISLL